MSESKESPADAELLIRSAEISVERAAAGSPAWTPSVNRASKLLRSPGASFVTLKKGGALRGCMGSLSPGRPLLQDVAANARNAALHDPRFPPVLPREVAALTIQIAALSSQEPLNCASEAELLEALQPGEDGLVLDADGQETTFLPAVWEMFPAPAEFVARLKEKAGLERSFWSPALRFRRYQVQRFDRSA